LAAHNCSWKPRLAAVHDCAPPEPLVDAPDPDSALLLADTQDLGGAQLRAPERLEDAQDFGGAQRLVDAQDYGGARLHSQEPLVGAPHLDRAQLRVDLQAWMSRISLAHSCS
jgi:hypothetical protein